MSHLNEQPEFPPAEHYEALGATGRKTEAETTISPKVAAQAAVSAGLVVLLAILTAVTPDMVAGLGAWAPLVYAGIVAFGGVVAGWVKRDPLREV